MAKSYIKVTDTAGQRYFSQDQHSPIYMLNLLKFKDIADYSMFPELTPENDISGFDAYGIYMQSVYPLILKAKSEVLFTGKADYFLIGPQDEKWDAVLLVRHASKSSFMAFASDPEYLKIEGHRTASLLDSRLMPISRFPDFDQD